MATGTSSSKTTNTPANLQTPVMTSELGVQIEQRITQLEAHYKLGENSLGCVFGRAPILSNGNTMMGYIGRIWLWNGLIDVATVSGPSLDIAVNRAFEDALLTLPQYSKTAGQRVA